MISYQTLQKEIENARVAELADAHGSGPCESNFMGVQVPPLAPRKKPLLSTKTREVSFMSTRGKSAQNTINQHQNRGWNGQMAAPAPVFCFSRHKMHPFFSRFSALQRSRPTFR